ncbi:MAG: DEAD/DEAH box helicase, partial [Bacteroidales bacterium]|nr:DEAD/DEAH box helicase [Bacteroidales bacterium]
ITELGFETPTPIQAETIPHLLQNAGQDLLGFAQTGTGKTAAFGLPIIQQINIDDKQTQSIILAPTRELCIQIAKDLEVYSKYLKKLRVVPVYGGASIDAQIKALAKGAQIVVGTPGRTLDLINRKRLKLKNVRWLVLDEADEMLNMGFKEELDKILSETPDNKQTLLFSATMPKDVARIAREYMRESKEIRVGEKNAGAENVSHSYYIVNASDKYAALKRIADINPDIYGIVFCRTRRDTKEVADKLIQDGYNADALHGDLSQAQRDIVMQRFRVKNLQILVATDVAARGLDVENLTHIINYSLPDDPEIYVHRSGRTGRAGKKGLSLTIAHSRELSKIKALERMVKKPFAKELIPGGIEIVEKRLYNLIDNIKQTDVDEKQIAPFLDDIFQKFEGLSREELIQKFVSVEFTRFLKYYKGAKDINLTVTDRKDRKSDRRSGNAQFTRFFINLGSKAGVNAAIMIGIINDNTHTRNMEIGKIDIMKRFSFFEVEKHNQKDIIQSFKNAKFRDQKIIVEVSESKPSSDEDSYGKRRSRGKRRPDSQTSSRRKNRSFDKRNKGKRR